MSESIFPTTPLAYVVGVPPKGEYQETFARENLTVQEAVDMAHEMAERGYHSVSVTSYTMSELDGEAENFVSLDWQSMATRAELEALSAATTSTVDNYSAESIAAADAWNNQSRSNVQHAFMLGESRALTELSHGATEPTDSPLSGEWAGDMTRADLYSELTGNHLYWGDEQGSEVADTFADAYERGYFGRYAFEEDARNESQSN